MRFSKTGFMGLLTAIFVLPFILYKLAWIARAEPAIGTRSFMGKTLNGQFSSEYAVIKFTSTGNDTVFFNAAEGVQLQPGEQVQILYHKDDMAAARVANFQGLWVDTTIYASIPLILILVIFFHPGIIPKKSFVVIGKKPFMQLLEPEEHPA